MQFEAGIKLKHRTQDNELFSFVVKDRNVDYWITEFLFDIQGIEEAKFTYGEGYEDDYECEWSVSKRVIQTMADYMAFGRLCICPEAYKQLSKEEERVLIELGNLILSVTRSLFNNERYFYFCKGR